MLRLGSGPRSRREQQENFGAAPQGPAAVQLPDQLLGLPQLPTRGHQGHEGTAHRAPKGIQLLPEPSQLPEEALEGGLPLLAALKAQAPEHALQDSNSGV